MSPSTLALPSADTVQVPRRRRAERPLARYVQPDGLAREIVLLPGAAGSRLLVDRLAGGLGDRRLVAHLPADEPAGNAQLLCGMYVADPDRCCRRLSSGDFDATALQLPDIPEAPLEVDLAGPQTDDYRLMVLDAQPRPRLRWTCRAGGEQPPQPVTVRDVVGALQHYDPVFALTRAALAAPPEGVCVHNLGVELSRMERTTVVLNRALREAVLHAVRLQGLSMSEIATRCGRVKRSPAGKVSGETSWLARRIGLRAEDAAGEPTPWIHHEVLALIARDGLGVAPGEVEVGTALSAARGWLR